MLDALILGSSGLVVVTGLVIMALGDWHNFGLKFAGVVISTMSAVGILGLEVSHPAVINCASDQRIIFGFTICAIFRNFATILFHLAAGRDSIQFRHRDRRNTCQTNSTQLSTFPAVRRKH